MNNSTRRSASAPVVVHVIGSLDRGGAETLALDLVRAIPADEVRQVFLCLAGREGVLADQFVDSGAGVVVVEGGLLRQLATLARTIQNEGATVVQAHVALTSAWFLIVARLTGVRVRIARIHNTADGRADSHLRRLYRFAARRAMSVAATAVFAVSPGAAEFALAGAGRRMRRLVEVVPNGVDLARFTYQGRTAVGEPTVIHVGRSAVAKNRGILAPIALELRKSIGVRFLVVGAGGNEDLGEHQDLLTVLGPRDDVATLLHDADVLILPSLREGLPGVVLEALASGVPVVASDISAMRSLRSLTGVELVSLEAPVDEWAAAITRAMRSDAKVRRRIADQLRESPFTLEKSVSRWRIEWSG